jgi:hypothetical protein
MKEVTGQWEAGIWQHEWDRLERSPNAVMIFLDCKIPKLPKPQSKHCDLLSFKDCFGIFNLIMKCGAIAAVAAIIAAGCCYTKQLRYCISLWDVSDLLHPLSSAIARYSQHYCESVMEVLCAENLITNPILVLWVCSSK